MKPVGLNHWVDEELTRISSIPKQLFKSNDAHLFEITKNLGWVCLALRHMREKAYLLDASPRDWDRIIERIFPKHKLETLNLYVSAGHNLHWDMELINKFQTLIPAEIVNYDGTPLEPMADQLHRLGLVTPARFENWARTNEDAKQQALREEEEARARIERAAREKTRKEREEQERTVREARARHEAEVRQAEQEKAAAERQAREAQARAEAAARRAAEAKEEEGAEAQAEAARAEAEAQAAKQVVEEKVEDVYRAEEAAKAADTLDPKYERMLDKLIAQSQGFRKIGLLFEQVEGALDLLPRKKVEALKRNILCLARVAEVLFPGGLE